MFFSVSVDFNVPLHKETGAVTNTQRIVAALPSIQYAIEKGARSDMLSAFLHWISDLFI